MQHCTTEHGPHSETSSTQCNMVPHPSEGGALCNMVPYGTTNKKFIHRDKSTQRKYTMQDACTQCNMAPHPDGGGGEPKVKHATCNIVQRKTDHTVKQHQNSEKCFPTQVRGSPKA